MTLIPTSRVIRSPNQMVPVAPQNGGGGITAKQTYIDQECVSLFVQKDLLDPISIQSRLSSYFLNWIRAAKEESQ